MSRETNARPSELLVVKIRDVKIKKAGNSKMYAEVEIGRYGKVKKFRTAPLISSLPYYKAWLSTKLFFSFLLLLYYSLLLADNILVTPAIL